MSFSMVDFDLKKLFMVDLPIVMESSSDCLDCLLSSNLWDVLMTFSRPARASIIPLMSKISPLSKSQVAWKESVYLSRVFLMYSSILF